MGIFTKVAKKWIRVNAKNIIIDICKNKGLKKSNILIEKEMGTGHERKLIANVNGVKYIYRLSINRGYDRVCKIQKFGIHNGVPFQPVLKYGLKWKAVIPVRYMVLRYVEGEKLNDKKHIKKEDIFKIGKIFGKMHGLKKEYIKYDIEYKNIEELRNRLINEIKKSWVKIKESLPINIGKKERESISWILERTNEMGKDIAQRMVHGDPHIENIISNKNSFFLIDTDSLRFGFAPIELGECLMSSYNKLKFKNQIKFIEGYKKEIDNELWREWNKRKRVLFSMALIRIVRKRINFAKYTGKEYRYKRAISFWKTFVRISGINKYNIKSIKDIMSVFNSVRREVE